MSIIFLDFDGVICVNGEFDCKALERVRKLCTNHSAKIVVSSDWRFVPESDGNDILLPKFASSAQEFCIQNGLPLGDLMHDDWATPIAGHRHHEIFKWLQAHPDVSSFVILDDTRSLFKGAVFKILDRLVLSDGRVGFTDNDYTLATSLLSTPL